MLMIINFLNHTYVGYWPRTNNTKFYIFLHKLQESLINAAILKI